VEQRGWSCGWAAVGEGAEDGDQVAEEAAWAAWLGGEGGDLGDGLVGGFGGDLGGGYAVQACDGRGPQEVPERWNLLQG
jgi:hypothetical protein